jgi:hypothetical protein
MGRVVRTQREQIRVARAPPTRSARVTRSDMDVHWPNDPDDDGNGLIGAFVVLLLEAGVAALVVAVIMLLR